MILLAFVLWLLAEIAAAIAVAHVVGVLVCVLLLIAGWPIGSLVLRAEGRATLRHLKDAYASGRPPAGGAGPGALALLAGPLLIIPGFVTDALAVLLLVPGVRRRLWTSIAGRARDRLDPTRRSRRGARRPDDIDATAHETTRGDRIVDRPQLHG